MSKEKIRCQLDELLAVAQRCEALLPMIGDTAELMIHTLRAGGKILSCGNGGSAADALHLAEELTGRYLRERPALAAVCLAADPTALTCIANDYGFESVFSRQLEALGCAGDLLVCFSTSGNSPNILRALEAARGADITSILMCGESAGKSAGLACHEVKVPSGTGARIQELHTFIIHQWLECMDAENWQN